MSGSVSPLPWTGNKGCIYTTIDAFMPPHRTYVEACMGSAEVFLRKKPVEKEIINDYNGDLVRFFRVLQRNENLERLIGRLFLSFNSEQIFRANKALLAEVPNILDDLTETSVIMKCMSNLMAPASSSSPTTTIHISGNWRITMDSILSCRSVCTICAKPQSRVICSRNS